MGCQTREFFFRVICLTVFLLAVTRADEPVDTSRLNVFPILMYDSDIGLGLGGKAMWKNYLRQRESFDLILFASNKGEQWYYFKFSQPDAELRQGTRYSLAVDVQIEWDKLLKSNYFGVGNSTPDNDYQFPKEFFKIQNTWGRAFTRNFIVEVTYTFTRHSVYGFNPAWGILQPNTPGVGENQVGVLGLSGRWDSRDSQLHPTRGERILLSGGLARPWLGSDWNYQVLRLELSGYRQLGWKNHVLAGRFWLQQIDGTAPFTEQSKIGGSWTARGYKADRFLDQGMTLASLEYRFPLYRRLGGVLFGDAGRVMNKLRDIRLEDWHSNLGWGLRYYLPNFVVRFDMGFSQEGTRIFFHFGQVF